MCTQLHFHRHTHSVRVTSLQSGIVTYGRESRLLLQAVTITERIYCRRLANTISAGGPEIIYQRFRDSRQHFTSFIQMPWANKIMIEHLAICVLYILTSSLLIDCLGPARTPREIDYY